MPACVKVTLLRSADSSGIWGLYSALLVQPELLCDQSRAHPSPKQPVKIGVWNAPRQVLPVLPAAVAPWWMSGNIPMLLLLWVQHQCESESKMWPWRFCLLRPQVGVSFLPSIGQQMPSLIFTKLSTNSSIFPVFMLIQNTSRKYLHV